MKKTMYLPTPNQIYLALKEKFASDEKSKVKLERLYEKWTKDYKNLDDLIPVKTPKSIWLIIFFWILMLSAVSVLVNKIYPFYPENIRELVSDNLARLTFLVVIVTGFLAGNFTILMVEDENPLSPKRMFHAFELQDKIKNVNEKKMGITVRKTLLFLTVASLFLLGYVWTMILAILIGLLIIFLHAAKIKTMYKKTKNAFDKD